MGDLFSEKNISPMLIADNTEPFADEGYLYEMKWDGERCVAYLDPDVGTELRNKRNVRMLPKVPELSELHHNAKHRCILDGELICLVNGKPDFSAIQRRSLMSNRYKIEMESVRFPATYIAFDCLYDDGEALIDRPLEFRKERLKRLIHESPRIAISRVYPSEAAMELFRLTQEQGLEGIVAKKKGSLYHFAKRTRTWLKMKNMMDDDFVVCGFAYKENHMVSIALGKFRGGKLISKGHVTLGVGGAAFEKIKQQLRLSRPPFDEAIMEDPDMFWISPQLVCVVEFMHYTVNGGMRQPVFKGLREDKSPRECVE